MGAEFGEEEGGGANFINHNQSKEMFRCDFPQIFCQFFLRSLDRFVMNCKPSAVSKFHLSFLGLWWHVSLVPKFAAVDNFSLPREILREVPRYNWRKLKINSSGKWAITKFEHLLHNLIPKEERSIAIFLSFVQISFLLNKARGNFH